MFGTVADYLMVAGFLVYLILYLFCLAFFAMRSRHAQHATLITIKSIFLSLIIAITGSALLFFYLLNALYG